MFLASVGGVQTAPTAYRLTPDRRRPSPGPVGFPPSALALVLLYGTHTELQLIPAVGALLCSVKKHDKVANLPGRFWALVGQHCSHKRDEDPA